MTLAPVFRSPEAVRALRTKGYLDELDPSLRALRDASDTLNTLLGDVIDRQYIQPDHTPQGDLDFLQDNFFLSLFHSIFRTVGCGPDHLELYTLLNFCIRGVVLSGDNLFDEEEKLVLPLALGRGRRFMSIVQMICFQGLIRTALARYGAWLSEEEKDRFHRDLLSALTAIGELEGSEETGVEHTLSVDAMIASVHGVRGGRLFSLAFIAPRIGEREDRRDSWRLAEEGVRRLGTTFQIVDDLTDIEFDLGRKSHNLLAAEVRQNGTDQERELLEALSASPAMRSEGGWVERGLHESAGRVLSHALREGTEGFRVLERIGFWFPPEDALLFVRAIAGDAGFERVQGLTTP